MSTEDTMGIEKNYALRERKFARTKVSLMREIVRRMEQTAFAAISIRDVCHAVEVSEGTFFNYFPQKIDVLYYFMQLQLTRVYCETLRRTAPGAYLVFIENLFQCLFEDFNNPYGVYEMISALVGQKQDIKETEISALEKHYAFPDCAGIEDVVVPSVLMENVFMDYLGRAVENKELPPRTDINAVALALKTIMVGLPLGLSIKDFQHTRRHYQQQIVMLWAGVREIYR